MINDQNLVIEKFTNQLNPEDVDDVRNDWHYMFQSKMKVDYRLISKIPGGLKDKVVLNIGTYFPIDEIYFASSIKKMYSIDIAPVIVKVAEEIADREIHPSFRSKIIFQVCDASNLPFEDHYFDVSFSFSTLEHIPEKEKREKAFSEIVRVTKKGGYVIITVPNKLNFGRYVRSLIMQKIGVSPFGYEHHYTPLELKKILIRNGVDPLFYCSSAGDLSGVMFRVHDFVVSPFGHRMGWIGIKK